LIASKQVNGRRLLSVLLGSSSELTRAQESLKLINWGYQYFDALKLYDKGAVVKELPVWKGSESSVKAGFQNDLYITVAKGLADKLKAELVATQLVAPIAQGQRVGVLRVTLDGKPYGEYPVVAIQAVPEAGLFGRAWDTVRLWFK
jgi:D-alanyl-D-alanine carboxypeptidase (penicillin-binding protein 5/6)